MKKILSLLLVMLMVFSLAACGTTPTPTDPVTEPQVNDQDGSETEEQTDGAPALSGTMKVVATSEAYVTLFDKFAAETGVKAELLSMSSGEVLSKLRAEGGTPSAYFIEWLFSSNENQLLLAEIDQQDGIALINPALEGLEVAFDTSILMELDLSLFGSQRADILAKFEPLMGDKAVTG